MLRLLVVCTAFLNSFGFDLERQANSSASSCTACLNGVCVNSQCFCVVGWTGDMCQYRLQKLDICEGKTGFIGCPVNQTLAITFVNYGRLSSSTCSDLFSLTNVPFAAKCDSHLTSTDVVKHDCEGRNYCGLWASNEKFGEDPCGGVYKYLRVTFYCRPIYAWSSWSPWTQCCGDTILQTRSRQCMMAANSTVTAVAIAACSNGSTAVAVQTQSCSSVTTVPCSATTPYPTFAAASSFVTNGAQPSTYGATALTSTSSSAVTGITSTPTTVFYHSKLSEDDTSCPLQPLRILGNVSDISINSLALCSQGCFAQDACVGYTYDKYNQICFYLREMCATQELTGNLQYVTYVKNVIGTQHCALFECGQPTKDPAFLGQQSGAQTYLDCATACDANSTCRAMMFGPTQFSFFESDKYLDCYLFSNRCSQPVASITAMYCFQP